MLLERKTKERCTPYLLFVIFVAALSGFLFGYYTGIISGALIFQTPAFQLSIIEQGMVVSFILLGAILGALIAGFLADRFGRKRTMMITAVIFVIGAIIICLSDSLEMLLLGRLISGLGVGVVSVVTPLYLAEISPPHYRGTFVSGYQLAITLGILGSFIVNYFFADSGNWRGMFGIGIFPALLQGVSLFFVPESPAFLFGQGFDALAIKTLSRLRKDTAWRHQIEVMKGGASSHKKGGWKILFSSKLRFCVLIGVVLSIFQQITGINTVIYYSPKIFEMAGFTTASIAILATLGIGIINVFATLFSVWLLDRVGRRILLLIGSLGMACSLGSLSIAFFSQSALIDQIALFSLMGYVVFFAIGLGPVTWVILSEIYPLKIRGKAMTLATFANWGCNYFVALTFLDLIHWIGAHGVFLLYALASLASFWFIFRFIPETKGKSLEEIELKLQ